MQPEDASFFDSRLEFGVLNRRVPHWDQAGVWAFITFRLHDSYPQALADRYKAERAELMRAAKCSLAADDWKAAIRKLSPRDASILRWKLYIAWDAKLDTLAGDCLLKDARLSKLVSDGLLKFDGDRYLMAAFVVMPNHVHLLAAFREEGMVLQQGAEWRRYFGREINARLNRTGHVWQQDQFDHLVRSEASFDRIRRYIIDNPAKARLLCGEYKLFVSANY